MAERHGQLCESHVGMTPLDLPNNLVPARGHVTSGSITRALHLS